MNKKYINKYTIVILVFLLLFLLIIKDLIMYKDLSYDTWGYNNLCNNLRSDNTTLFMTIITGFGSFIFITSLLIVLLLLYKNKKTVYYIIINTISIFLINDFVKHIFNRPRPSGFNIVNETGFSFPSSHVMVSVVIYGLLSYLAYKKINNKIIKYSVMILLSILVLLISISRIYLGVHYLSDVVGGLSLGIIYLMIFLMLNKDFEKKV